MNQNARHYAHVDCPGHADYVKNMITGAAQMDGSNISSICSGWPNAANTRAYCVGDAGRCTEDGSIFE